MTKVVTKSPSHKRVCSRLTSTPCLAEKPDQERWRRGEMLVGYQATDGWVEEEY